MRIEQIISEIKKVEDPVDQMKFRWEIINAIGDRHFQLSWESLSPDERRKMRRAARATMKEVPGVLRQIDRFLKGIESSPATEESHSIKFKFGRKPIR